MLSLLLRRQPKKHLAPPVERVQPEVPYDPGLIAALTHEHRSLDLLLVKARSAAQQNHYEDVMDIMAEFRSALEDHLRRESIELYPYLAAHLKGENSEEVLKEMRMNGVMIRRTMEGFLDHYRTYPVSYINVAHFEIEVGGVDEELRDRLEQEEASIYTLYLPPDAY